MALPSARRIAVLAAWRRLVARLRHDRRGSVAAFVAIALIPLVGVIGVGTDAARAYLVKSRLSSALDAAGLAGGRNFFSETRDADIEMFFKANFPAGYMGATVSGPTVVVNQESEKITLSATATLDSTFMRLFGHDKITVGAAAEVTRQMTALDLVISIDMSGSMTSSAGSGMSRIAAARNAATTLIDILFGSDDSKALLKIGLVPWNGKVNITLAGTTFNPSATTTQTVDGFVNPETGSTQNVVYFANNSPVPLLAAPPSGWAGCVFNRFKNDGDATTDADILLGPAFPDGADWPAWQPILPGTYPTWGGEPVPGSARCTMAVGNNECTPCLSHGITPLQNQKQTILDAVNALVSPTGTTNIPAGLAWAWRVLKPAPPFTEAVPDPPYKRQQAIVLLTDGENYAGPGDGYKTTFGNGSAGQSGMDQRLRLLADNIKADGVLIYVIQFGNSGTALEALLRSVASGPQAPYYHYAPDAAALQKVFREIANHLSELRLSK